MTKPEQNNPMGAEITGEAKRFNDRVIDDGFPDGWFVQDRLDSGEALLCRGYLMHQIGFFPQTCICLRPKAITTDDWLPIARRIAHGFDLMKGTQNDQS